MKKVMVAVLAAFAAAAFGLSAHAATINQVIVRQQWPWSTDVKVEYQLEGVDASHPVDLAVTAPPISTKLFSSSRSEIRLPAEPDGILLISTSCKYI